jgi:heme exporter protein D
MGNMDGWDVALLAMAGYVALVTLVRLMIHRRDQLLREFRRKLQEEQHRKEAEQRDRKYRRPRAA